VAAGEYETQAIVLDTLVVVERLRVGGDGVDLVGNIVDGVESRAPAYAVDGLETTGRDEPRARIVRYTIARPLLQRRLEGIVQRLFGDVEITEQADQRGEDTARLRAVDGFYLRARKRGRILAHV
jgi:hypothetical protein